MPERAYDILPALDFNALHCGDLGARRYYELAAERIRSEEAEGTYWRRRATAEKVRAREYRREADTLAMLLERLLNAEDETLANQSPNTGGTNA